MIPLKEHYATTVVPDLKDKLGLSSIMSVPKVTKVTLNQPAYTITDLRRELNFHKGQIYRIEFTKTP